jgi:ACR3 family arsenite transporter
VPDSPAATPIPADAAGLDRLLPLWIGIAMGVGVLLGRLLPGLDSALEAVKVGSVSLPIAIGLLTMMYPVLAKVKYRSLQGVLADRQSLVLSLVLNWVVGPAPCSASRG